MHEGTWNKISNRADWIDCIEFIDRETDEPIDLSSVQDILLQLVYPQSSGGGMVYDGYGATNFRGAGVSLRNGTIQHVQTGVIQFHFTAGVMNGLAPQVYDMGLGIVSQDGIITQMIIGQVPVVEGFVMSPPFVQA